MRTQTRSHTPTHNQYRAHALHDAGLRGAIMPNLAAMGVEVLRKGSPKTSPQQRLAPRSRGRRHLLPLCRSWALSMPSPPPPPTLAPGARPRQHPLLPRLRPHPPSPRLLRLQRAPQPVHDDRLAHQKMRGPRTNPTAVNCKLPDAERAMKI